MKISAVIGALVILVAAILYIVSAPPNHMSQEIGEQEKQSNLTEEDVRSSEAVSTADIDADKEAAYDENRRIEMQTAFSVLEKSRKELKSRANLLKSKIWGRELPAERARMISYKMRQAYAYLKNPPMLGAYFEVNEIQSEINKVRDMLEDLTELEQSINASQNGKS